MPFDSSNPARRCAGAWQTALFTLLLGSFAALSGCATPQQTYVNAHPELSADHRKVIIAAKLSDRDPVAGMTREQIRLTMNVDPTQMTSINGEEAWVWVKKKADPLSMAGESSHSGSSGSGSFSNLPSVTDSEPGKPVMVRTTVFFKGNTTTRVDVTEEKL